jgi:uncharacterized protein (DUF1330 family)
MAAYQAAGSPILQHWGGTALIANGRRRSVEGGWQPVEFYVIEFASFAQAEAFYFSAEYQAVLPARLAAALSKAILIEGAAPSL